MYVRTYVRKDVHTLPFLSIFPLKKKTLVSPPRPCRSFFIVRILCNYVLLQSTYIRSNYIKLTHFTSLYHRFTYNNNNNNYLLFIFNLVTCMHVCTGGSYVSQLGTCTYHFTYFLSLCPLKKLFTWLQRGALSLSVLKKKKENYTLK